MGWMFHVILAQAVAHLFTCIYFHDQFVVVLYYYIWFSAMFLVSGIEKYWPDWQQGIKKGLYRVLTTGWVERLVRSALCT
jgi:hypothetical protein